MWECSIILDGKNDENSEYIKKKLTRYKALGVIFAEHFQDGKTSLNIACKEEYANHIALQVADAIAELVILTYKEDFYKQRMSIGGLNPVSEKALIKALFLFDIDDDKETILHYLKLKRTIYLKSFFDFQLRELRDKWMGIIALTQDNFYYFLNSNVFIDVLKFLLSAIPHKYDEISVGFTGDEFVLLDENYHQIYFDFPDSMNNEIGLVSNLIFLSPKKVNLLCLQYLSKPTFNILYNVFNQCINFSEK